MQVSHGSSLQVAFWVAEALVDVSVFTLKAVWERWHGSHRLERSLAQFQQRGWLQIAASKNPEARIVRFNQAGRLAALGGRDPDRCWNRTWDGRWRLVLYDVPEARRHLRLGLRRTLRGLGFGYLQDSAWISPDPVETLTATMRSAAVDVESLSFMEARPCGGESHADFVAGAWSFDQINRDYEAHIQVLTRLPATRGESAIQHWVEVERKAWRRAIRGDPLLPEALLPANYRGREAWLRRKAAFRELVQTHYLA